MKPHDEKWEYDGMTGVDTAEGGFNCHDARRAILAAAAPEMAKELLFLKPLLTENYRARVDAILEKAGITQ